MSAAAVASVHAPAAGVAAAMEEWLVSTRVLVTLAKGLPPGASEPIMVFMGPATTELATVMFLPRLVMARV